MRKRPETEGEMMKKYTVMGIMSASVILGEYEAESKEQAEEMAEQDDSADWTPTLCHHCSDEIELNDIYKVEVEEFEGR